MIKLKINEFKLNMQDRAGIPVRLPASLSSSLLSNGQLSPTGEALTVELSGVIEIEPHLLSMKHVCLRLVGISAPAEIVLNGKTISTPDSRERIYVYNVKDRLFPGYNTLVIRFQRARAEYPQGIRVRDGEPYDPAIESVELLAFDSAAISSVTVTEESSDSGVTLNVTMGLIGLKDGVRAVATLVSPSGKIYYGGLVEGRGSITVSDPLLWWPVGMGVPNLYDLSVNLYYGDVAEDVFEARIGIREIDAELKDGSVFLRVNGVPAFLKGARLVPATDDSSFRSIGEERHLVSTAASLGINALYVSPEGRAPSRAFIDLCDEYGILMIYGVTVTGGETLGDSVKRELADGPRRISYHASTAAFYVNREAQTPTDELRELLLTYCPKIPVLVGTGEPYADALPSLPDRSVLSAIATDDEANLTSRSVEAKTDGSLADTIAGVIREYRFPEGTDELSYLSELLAAQTVYSAILSARLEGGSCFINRLNDGSPRISPSLIDSLGGKKAAAYRLSRLYAPVTVLHRVSGTAVDLILFNDRSKEYAGTLTYRVLDRNNSELYSGSVECIVPSASSMTVRTLELSEFITGHEGHRYLSYSYSDGTEIFSDTVIFTEHKRFGYKPPKIKATVTGSGRRFDVTLSAEAFAGAVYLSFERSTATFDVNFFDITDSRPIRVRVETSDIVSAERLASELRIISMYDVGRDAFGSSPDGEIDH